MSMNKIAAANALAEQMNSADGRYEVGQQMLEPFKEGRDYVAIGRKVMAVHHLEPGAPVWYDIDPQFSATTVGERGGAPRVLDGKTYERIEAKPFPIAQAIRVSVEEPAIRRFDVLDRLQVRAQAEMAGAEDIEVFACLRAGASAGSGIADGKIPPGIVTGAFNTSNLSTVFASVEDYDVNVENLLMKPSTYKYIRQMFSDTQTFDPCTKRELWKTGYMGDLWNAHVRQSRKMAANEVLAVASPEFVGVMAIRIDLSFMDSPSPENLQYGWIFYSYICPVVTTNVGCAKLSIA